MVDPHTSGKSVIPLEEVTGFKLKNAFRALRHRNFKLWWFGQWISLIGTWMQIIAQNWLVYRLTDSTTALGLVSFTNVISMIPLAFIGGSIADRYAKRTILIATQIAQMILAAILCLLTWVDIVQFWQILILSFALGAVMGFDMPARQAFVIEMVGREDLANAIALNSSAFNAARTLGPAVAGILVALFGEAPAFLINSLSFLAVIFSLLLITVVSRIELEESNRLISHIREGMGYLRDHRSLLLIFALIGAATFFGLPYVTLIPVFAKNILQGDSVTYGILASSEGAGAVLGALFAASMSQSSRKGLFVSATSILSPLCVIGFCYSREIFLSTAFIFLCGALFTAQAAMCNALIQLKVTDAFRGRVMSIYGLMFMGFMRTGGFVFSTIAEFVDIRITVFSSAFIYLAISVFLISRWSEIRQLK